MKTQAAYSRYLRLLKTLLPRKTDAELLNIYYAEPQPDFHHRCLLKFQCRMELIKRGWRPYRVAGIDLALTKRAKLL